MGGEDLRPSRHVLAPEPSSVSLARRAVRVWLADCGRPDLIENAELAISEVVTNALVHAGTAVEVTFHAAGPSLRIEVGDGNTHLPRLRHVDATNGTGRGLTLLEWLVDRWGADVHDQGKVVWFELGAAARHDSAALLDEEGSAAVATPGAHAITLHDAPLLLFAAWREHASALLREHMLVGIDADGSPDVLQRHAAASEALALLHEQWPDLTLDLAPGRLIADAAPHLMATADLTLIVPHAVVASFGVLDEILDDALRMADAGLLLTPPTQPEARTARRWLTSEIARQVAGGAPQPHPSDIASPSSRPRIDWDARQVDESSNACLAADDTGAIVAASASALALLGHDRAGLVGRRLIEIIPERFHQAHVAGLSLHLITGHAPLLGAPVSVPARRRDGEELMVELTIRAHRLPRGRSVFVADVHAD